MTDVHLRILRAVARSHARQLDDHEAAPGETPAASSARRVTRERLAIRARRRLSNAEARRKHEDPRP